MGGGGNAYKRISAPHQMSMKHTVLYNVIIFCLLFCYYYYFVIILDERMDVAEKR